MYNDTLSRPSTGFTVQDSGDSFEHTPTRQISSNTPFIRPSSTGQMAEIVGSVLQGNLPVTTTQQTGLPVVPNMSYSGYQQQYTTPAPPVKKRIRWRTIGLVLALIKLGLVKLVAYGFKRILLLVLFKLKIILVVLFLKLIFLLKSSMFLKLQVLPSLLLLSLPVLASLVYPAAVVRLPSVPSRIMNTILGHVDSVAHPTSIDPSKASDLSPSDTKTSIFHGSSTPLRDVDKAQLMVNDISEPIVDYFDLTGGRRFDSLEPSNLASSFFRKAIGSEKCVERIACELALARRAGSTLAWIDW